MTDFTSSRESPGTPLGVNSIGFSFDLMAIANSVVVAVLQMSHHSDADTLPSSITFVIIGFSAWITANKITKVLRLVNVLIGFNILELIK